MSRLFLVPLSVGLFKNVGGVWIDTRYTDFQQGIYDAEIYISRRLQQETNPSDSGCIEYHVRFDVNNDGWYDLISADEFGPNLTIWLGSSSGYSDANCLTYSITSGGNCDISDLNLDGYPELIHSGYRMGYARIYWGTATGPSSTNITSLPNNDAEAVYVADFDKDTYLDIVLAGSNGFLYIYWGSSSGYSSSNRLDINIGTTLAHNIEAADLDNNGYLDIIVIEQDSPYDIVILYQTSTRNFISSSLDFADTSHSHGLSIADLDNDGYIDIIATAWKNITYSSIYWGSSSGYNNTNKLDLNPGKCYGGSAVADFNQDSLIDILYYRGTLDTIKPIIYYNLGVAPYFSDNDTHEIGIPLRASGGTVADFNYDGELDIFVNNGINNSYSYVFYGPNFNVYDSLPVNDDHHGTFREPRQIPSYYSKVVCPCSLSPDTIIIGGDVSWIANTPGSSIVYIFVRTGNTPIPDTSWTNWYEVTTNPGPIPSQVLYHRYIQYKADLYWDNPAELPNLERVEIITNCSSVGIESEQSTGTDIDFSITPASPNVIIKLNTPYNAILTIFDIVGKKLYEQQCERGSNFVNWGDSNPAGIYFCVIKYANIKLNKKFIKFK